MDDLGAFARPWQSDPGLVWSASGFAPAALEGLQRQLGLTIAVAPTVDGTAGASPEAKPLEAGDAVSVLLVDGDARQRTG